MQPTIVTENTFQLTLCHPGELPARVDVAHPSGRACVALLPAVAVLGESTLGADETEAAIALVRRHRDGLLAEWLKGLGQPRPPARGPLVASASFDAARKLVNLRLKSGAFFAYPIQLDAGMREAPAEGLSQIEVVGEGEALRWPALGMVRRAADLILAFSGGEAWRQRLLPLAGPARPGAPVPPGPRPAGAVKSLIGLILERERLLNAQQLQAIAAEQARLASQNQPATFGAVAMQLGFLTQAQLDFGVQLQAYLAHPPGSGKPLGVHLLEAGALLPSQLLDALNEQKRTGGKLGEILIERGLLTPAALELFLGRQQQAKAPPAAAGGSMIKSLLGLILERENYMNTAQVQAVTQEQERLKREGKRGSFGEIALNMGYVSQEQLRFAIQLQTKLAYTPGQPKPLGCVLLENGVVKPSQIMIALEAQQKTGKRLGEVLVEQGLLSESMLEVFLKMQRGS